MDKSSSHTVSRAHSNNNNDSFSEPIRLARPRQRCYFPQFIVIGFVSFLLGGCTLWTVQHVFFPKSSSNNSITEVFVHGISERIYAETQLFLQIQNQANTENGTKPEETNPDENGPATEEPTGPDGQSNGTQVTKKPQKPKEKPNALQLRISKELKVVPESYDLTVKLYLPGYNAEFTKEKELKFDGKVHIILLAGKPTDIIELSASKMVIDKELSFVEKNGKRIGIADIQMQEELKKVKITLKEKVQTGKLEMQLVYVGEISTRLDGLYQSKYINNMGVEKITAVTQMEAEYARFFVPCFDEPEYKANWNVTIIHPKGTEAISNGNKTSTNESDKYFLTSTFKQTPKMSSYLLAIFVGDFTYQEGKFSNGNKTLRIWSRPEALEETSYALEAGIKSLHCFEELYNIKYPLAKQDMLALPDFAAGAMENWGLITYREIRLLYNNRTYSMTQKREIASVIAHELAHQWFGNLVTMKWWNDLWLNEGFATFMQHVCLEKINEDYLPEDFILTRDVSVALEADSSAASHPLSSQIDTVEEVMESFDTISYKKGASVIRMIKKVMERKPFEEGIELYLNKFEYSNTDATDLWSSLDEKKRPDAKGLRGKALNITELALQWTLQMGYPVLTMEKEGSMLKITAERFKKNKNAKEQQKYAYPEYGFKWDVPLWYEVGGVERFIWVPRGEAAWITLTEETVILNAGLSSFVRTNYDEFSWKRIIDAMKKNPESFSHRTRYTVIQDAFEMASVDKLSYSLLFELISYAEKETHYLPMSAIVDGLSKLGKFFTGADESRVLRKYVKKILRSAYELVSLDEIARRDGKESEMHKNLQEIQVFFKYCANKDSGCIAKIVNLFETEVMAKCTRENDIASECSTVSASIRKSVYCDAVRHGDEAVFDKLLNLYKRETDPSEKNSLMTALTCTTDIPTLRFLLESITKNSGLFRYQDATPFIYTGVAANEIGAEFIFNFMISKWDQLYKTFKDSPSFIRSIISTTVTTVRNKQEMQQLKDFIASTPEAAKLYEFTKSMENADYRLNWIKKNLKEVTKIMKNLL